MPTNSNSEHRLLSIAIPFLAFVRDFGLYDEARQLHSGNDLYFDPGVRRDPRDLRRIAAPVFLIREMTSFTIEARPSQYWDQMKELARLRLRGV